MECLPPYGDLTDLNTDRTLLSTIGKPRLTSIAQSLLALMGTSAAIYEANGDYAVALFTSDYCRALDTASRDLCVGQDNAAALVSGQWHCHESCWTECSKIAIETGQPHDLRHCRGGISIYAVPIVAASRVIGAVNFGYGTPPTDEISVAEIASRYGMDAEHLTSLACAAPTRSNEVICAAKGLLKELASQIAELYLRVIAEKNLLKNEKLISNASRMAQVSGWYYDVRNDRFEMGKELAEIHGTRAGGRSMSEMLALVHPDDLTMLKRAFSDSLTYGSPYVNRHRVIRPDTGEIRYIEAHADIECDTQGHPIRLWGVAQDITERRQMEVAIKESEQKYRMLYEHAPLAYQSLDEEGCFRDVNPTWLKTLGYRRDEVIGATFADLLHPDWKAQFADKFPEFKKRGSVSNVHFRMRHKTGRYLDVVFDGCVNYTPEGEFNQTYCVFKDVTEEYRYQKQLEHMVRYDSLTDLPNRVMIADRLHQAMLQAKRRNKILGIAYLDLDGFKAVNDTHGHGIGDQLLATLAYSMRETLREGDTFGRLGGDEFVAVLIDLESSESCLPMLKRLLHTASQPVMVSDRKLQVSASLGVTFYPTSGADVDAEQLLRQADQAMYQAKLAGKNRYQVFDADHDTNLRSYHESLEEIRGALRNGEFVLYYQPQVNMRSGQLIGVEALIRWQHPEKGVVSPQAFLPVIENHGLSVDLGNWVIEEALRQLDSWRAQGVGVSMSINIGALQLQRPDFIVRLKRSFCAYPQLRPSDLKLEVVETSALEDMSNVTKVLSEGAALGVDFALDDFGTGYSSLTYLRHLPVAQLKIDQSFIRDMLDDPEDLAILEAVLGLADAFRRQVIAEGVETVEHGRMLLRLGCELAQGYAIALPMPADEFPGWSSTWVPDASWTDERRLSRDERPLVLASVEHRAWTKHLEEYLGKVREDPPLGLRQCRFGRWLDGEARPRFEEHHALERVETLHLRIHELADLLIEGGNPNALQLSGVAMADVKKLSRNLLDELDALIGKD